ncbi:MAG: hypothetical protein P9X24_19875, partial [Candidatus Hatepunaea meridiana]|nr:hypothetical protein [Candidatus Hatepunaea meridiana]
MGLKSHLKRILPQQVHFAYNRIIGYAFSSAMYKINNTGVAKLAARPLNNTGVEKLSARPLNNTG